MSTFTAPWRKTPAKHADARPAAPELVNAAAVAAATNPAPPRPPTSSRYMPAIFLSPLAASLPPTRTAQWPTAAQLREIGLDEVADAIDAHSAASAALHRAIRAYDEAEPPRGPAWRAAVARAHDALQAGAPDPARVVRELLAAEPDRVAATVTAAWVVVDAFGAVLDAATRADPATAEAAVDAWTADAVDAVKSVDRGRLVQLEQEVSAGGKYGTLRGLWQWLHDDGAGPYQAVRSALPQPVAEAIIENHEQIGQLMVDRGIFSTTVLHQLMPGGTPEWSA